MNSKNKLEKYIQYLYCPHCGKRLSRKKDNFNLLICQNKKHSFPINEGIPGLVDKKLLSKLQKETQKAFNYKWFHPSVEKYGLNGPEMDFQRKWYLKKYGFKNNKDFNQFIKSKKNVLDAGCGSGWGAKWFSEKNKKGMIFTADLSKNSALLMSENFKNVDNVFSVQADIGKLPFSEGFFDFISCEQVLHHTSNPHKVFLHLLSRLKKGGVFCFYLYKKKALLRELADTHIREKTVKMSQKECYRFSEAITLLGRSLSRLNVKLNVPKDIPLLGIKKGTCDLQRFIYWNFLKCFFNEEWGFHRSVIVNFDWYSPKTAFRYDEKEIKQWVKDEKLKLLNFYVDDACIGVKVEK
ncbi:MAG: methyltransferase domain-containing protein [Candidatus Pacebacteria bacterium]|nr:methyltransferase domain-containing protein [Candidatus Paceibacterota bacterium]MDD4201266.1 methyltransferase domain-containing protein [Candidatus Paceibacterota bacterium]